VPVLPAVDVVTTPTLDLLATPAGTAPANGVVSLVTPEAQSGMSGCVPEEIMIASPESGDVISGTVELTGTVNVQNFGFYKYEFAPAGTDNWITIAAGTEIKKDESLGPWDTTTLTNGDYFLQLVIIDNVGQTIQPCIISVRVANQ
jgi:hypothetical protein